MTPGALAAAERVKPPSMTRVLASLSDLGMIERAPHPTDGRQAIVTLAPAGEDVIVAEHAARRAWLSDQIDALTERASELEGILRDEAERARRSVVVPGFKISYQEIREKPAMTPAQFIKAHGLEIPNVILEVPEVKTVIRRVKTD